MSIKALQEYTRFSKYSRFVPELKRRETWDEQVDRVFKMHEQKYPDKIESIREDFEFAKQMVKRKRVLGSQRALQFGGKPILDKNAKLYNCTVSYVDRPRFFQECMYLLLCGCGTGFSVQKHHVAKLNGIGARNKETKTYVIPDSIEGWADAVGVLVSSYFTGEVPFPEFQGHIVSFDFSQIRPAGAPLSWGGRAPGPKGLMQALKKIENVFEATLVNSTKLRPIDAYDIIMHASDAVLSGGIRRSATICIFSPDDTEMANAKTGDWFIKNPQRGRSNNSALLIREKTTKEDFERLMKSVREFGEPGFIWSENTESLYNPCVEINMRAYDKNGMSGWQFCLTGDTLIQTESGYKTLMELEKEKNVKIVSTYSNDKKGYGDYTDNVIRNATVYDTGIKSVYKINTISGPQIKATANHSVLTQRGYVRVDELDIEKDSLVSSMNNSVINEYDRNVETYIPNMYDLLGWNLGDGWCSGNRSFGLVFGSREDDNAEKKLVPLFQTLLNSTDGGSYENRYGDVDIAIDNDADGVRCYSSGNSSKRKSIIEEWGMSVGNAHSKQIMKKYWNSSLENKARYLSAWFCADGSVVNKNGIKRVSISIANDKLAEELQIALTEFGILSRRTPHVRLRDGKNQTVLYIGNMLDILKFKETIGFRLHPRKSADLDAMTWDKPGTVARGLFKIKSIEYCGEERVYDINVEDSHNFVANGLVVHNCNLCEINMKKCKTEEGFMDACRAAAIIGTMQAGYDTFDYLGPVTESIVRREALLGCSMTGMMDSPEIAFDPAIQKKGAKHILKINEAIAAKLGVNKCARATCVKPAGSTSCLLGSASGIHPHHAKRYFRRVQANVNETPLQYFQAHNPRAVEKSVWSATGTDMSIIFLCEVPEGAKLKNQLNAVQLLEHVRLTQQNWVEYGTRDDAPVAPWLRHNVSNTITVRDDEWDDVTKFIYNNRKWFAGISLLPMSGDLDYVQAPFCSVLDSREIISEYGEGALFASGLIVDGLHAFDNNLWAACDSALGIGEKLELTDDQKKLTNGKLKAVVDKLTIKDDWVRRFKQFAERYCDGNLRRCSHLLKHVSNYKLWQDLKREYQEVDWSLCMEEDFKIDVTTIAGAACSGPGGCEMK